MSDLNDVKAGSYQLVARRWDQITSKPGEPLDYVRHGRGDVVDLNVQDAKRLVAAGAVVKPGQLERNAAEQARAVAEQAQRNYEAVLAGLPDEVRAEVAPSTVAATGAAEFDPAAGGTIPDTMTWVGEDAERAEQVLDLEQAKDTPRSGLVEKLQGVISAGS